MSQRTNQFIALGGMIIMLILYGLTSAGLMGPNPVGSTSTDTAPLIVPAPYAFSIWGPIYLGLVVFPIYQLIVDRKNHEAWKPLRIWYALNVVANGVWLVFASYDWQWMTLAVIVFMLFTLFRINTLGRQITASGATVNFWAERLVFSLYFAWITLATVLNVASALHFYDWDGFGISEVNWTLIMVPIAALITGYTARTYRDIGYAAVVVWAFIALTVKHWGSSVPTLAYASLAVVVIFTGLIVSFISSGQRLKNL